MIRRLLTLLPLALMATGLLSAQSRPNIIFFFVDDLGYGDIGCFWQDQRASGKKFDTPALDSMAAEGAKLTHHYVSASVCAPSRASLLTGRHQGHCEVRNSQFDKALPINHNIASVLKTAGYRTIHIGKSGLAGGENSTNLSGTGSQNLAGHPLGQGFDRFFGYLFHGDGHEHYPRNGTTNKTAHLYDDYQQITNASTDLYTTDLWTASAKQEIINELTDGDDQPFFLYLAYDAPHFNMQRPAVPYPEIDDDGDPLTGGIQWTTAADSSGKVRYASTADGTGSVDSHTHPDIPSGWANSEKQHVGMIRRIDNSVADILQTLKDLGIDDNTLCVFSSDNGPHNEGNNPRTFESFANMEGIKRDMWEAGIRVPTIVRWPGKIAEATGNENNIHEIDYPSGTWDWMPTFCEMAGVTAPAWCDGVSLIPTLTGTGSQRDKDYLYFEFQRSGSTPNWVEFPNHRGEAQGQMQALRMGDYMGVRTSISSGSEPFQIFDVTTDTGQSNDLAASQPGLQAQMQAFALTARRPGAGVSRPYDNLALPSVNPGTVQAGIGWQSFTDPGATWQWVPEFRDLTPAASGTTPTINIAVRPADENFGLLFSGYLQILTTGSYQFHLGSDTGAQFFLHDSHLIDEDYNHNGDVTSPSVQLEAGLHPIRLYYRHATGPRDLSLDWSGPSITRQPIPTSALFSKGTLELTAVDDSKTIISGQAELIDVLANDYDDGQPAAITISNVSSPNFGTAMIENGQIRFTPPAGFQGTATFTYTITDGEGTATANVSITVTRLNPTAYWDFEGNVTESVSGTVGTLKVSAAANGNALAPIGSNSLSLPSDVSYLETNTNGSLGGTSSFTVLAFIETTTTANATIFNYSPSGGSPGGSALRLFAQANGDLRIEMNSGAAFVVSDAAWDLGDGNAHMVAVVFDSSTGNSFRDVDLFVDGTLYNITSGTDHLVNLGNGGEIFLGRSHVTPENRPYSGSIDDVAIYDEALTLAELATIQANGVVDSTDSFATWIADPAWGLAAADRDFNDDPDQDGLANGLEAWFGTHPGEFSAGLTRPRTAGTTSTLTHSRNESPPSGMTAFYEWSTNLNDWYAGDGVDGPGDGLTVTITSEIDEATTTVTATASSSAELLFLRVGVTQN